MKTPRLIAIFLTVFVVAVHAQTAPTIITDSLPDGKTFVTYDGFI